ncbi:probable LRR receptor-like serine/threonine-protein kinase At5g59680 [Papaver somniferum]|uniref:probable LRR receptor-like serine/threonine-protein kinase At5g59680 n=1 Tax=Papaver somniferum TaxID=3469 RepID=UPI000E70513B|nr:probable LRR receptor-like serine/threonine-protein kinase At5g59680 [Papaver somniferum]
MLSLFIAPPKVGKAIEKVIRDFLWDASDTKKGYHYVKWKTCCLPPKAGGLGIKFVRSINKALISKWRWQFNHEKTVLWRNGIVSKYELTQQDRETKNRSNRITVVFGKESTLFVTPSSSTILKVEDGNSIRFWEDQWVGEHPFNVTFPNIYRISSVKNWTIRKCAEILANGGSWNLGLDRRLNQAQIDEAIALSVIIEQCRMDGNHDVVSWAIDKNRTFSVKSAYSWVEKEHQLEAKNLNVWSRLWAHKIGKSLVCLKISRILRNVPFKVCLGGVLAPVVLGLFQSKVFAHLSCFFVLVPVSAKVFLSIDCGSSSLKSRTDNNSIAWVGDGPYIKTGKTHKVNVAPPNISGWDSRAVSTLRAFPARKKNCYSIDIEIVTTNGIIYYEVVFSLNKSSNIDVCLAQAQPDNIPFISALEIRSLDPGAYGYIPADFPLFFTERTAYGTNTTIRYPDDSFDRIWSSLGPLDNTSTVTRVRSNSPSIKVDVEDKPPKAVLRTTLLPLNSSHDIFYSPTRNHQFRLHFNAYFSEVIKLNSTQKRSFDIVVNNKQDNSFIASKNPVIPPYGRTLEVHILNVTIFNSSFSINLLRTNDSTLPPLINALEEFIIGDKLAQGTNSNDVKALGLLKKSFAQLQDWNGDPCLPSPYTWDWVACNDDTDSPRITALYLNNLGLTGTLPDFSAMDALRTINLSNNNLTREIPEFLGTFPELTVLNLADNNFNGTVPSSISDDVNLKFNATGNPNLLCTPTSVCNTDLESRIPPPSTGNTDPESRIPPPPSTGNTDTEPRIPSPVDKGRSSKTFAQPIIILLIMFSGLLL